jgi:hypothetical protein
MDHRVNPGGGEVRVRLLSYLPPLAENGVEVAVNGRKAADIDDAIRAAVSKAKLVATPGDVSPADRIAAVIVPPGMSISY